MYTYYQKMQGYGVQAASNSMRKDTKSFARVLRKGLPHLPHHRAYSASSAQQL